MKKKMNGTKYSSYLSYSTSQSANVKATYFESSPLLRSN